MNRPPGIPPTYVETSPGVWCHPSRGMGTVAVPKPQPETGRALEQDLSRRRSGQAGLAGGADTASGCCVEVDLIACVHRRCDDDNITAGCKPLRDAVAASLGLDDGDPRLIFRVHQVVGSGPEGTLVMVTVGA